MMIKAAYFPTIIYAKDVNLDNRLFEKEVLAWADKDKGVKRTNMNGWHSQTNMHEIPVFKPLVDELFKMQNEVFQEEWLESEPHMGNMWANINPPGGYNSPHLHPNSHYSGVYYIKAPEGGGDITFPQLKQKVTPKDNMMILFDGHTRHGVTENLSDEERIAVSFNVKEDF